MQKNRLEAFSDGVIAIIITVMVLEMHVPRGASWSSLGAVWPVFVSYVMSFIYVGIYWNNHHHMLQATRSISAGVLWANLHLLFWLSLLPFTTGWMGQNPFTPVPMALYGINLLACAVAYTVLQTSLVAHHGRESAFAAALGNDAKGKLSLVLYGIGICAAWLASPMLGFAVFACVALIWLVPDRRMESVVDKSRENRKD
jgi:uncharacterized membrane protein